MPKRDERAYLHDMLSHAEEAIKLCSGHTIETFSANAILRWAVIKLVEIVGEASIKSSDATRAQYPQIPWKELRGMRNILVHVYEGIEDVVVALNRSNLSKKAR